MDKNLVNKYSGLQKFWFIISSVMLLAAGCVFVYYFFIGDVTNSKVEYLVKLKNDLLVTEVRSVLEKDLRTIAKDLCIKMMALVDINDRFTGFLLASFLFIISALCFLISRIYKSFCEQTKGAGPLAKET